MSLYDRVRDGNGWFPHAWSPRNLWFNFWSSFTPPVSLYPESCITNVFRNHLNAVWSLSLNTCYRVFSACAIEDCYGGDKMLIQLELLLSALRSYSLRFAKQNFRSLASRFIEFGSLCSPSLYAKFN